MSNLEKSQIKANNPNNATSSLELDKTKPEKVNFNFN